MKSGTSDVADFAAQYSALSDCELLAILNQRETLMDSAVMALDAEIARRQLNISGSTELTGNETKTSPNPELPYRWGRFVGGMTVVGALLSGAAALIQKDFVGIGVSALSVFVGFGIYNMRKWAVWLLEIGTCLSVVLVLAILLISSHSARAEGLVGVLMFAMLVVLFYGPQTIYFWKRRKQLR